MQQHLLISIPEPCHENWEEMTPDGAGRFCGHCRKTVVDFTLFTDAQLFEYFEGRKESVCGRLQVSQVNRIIHIPPQPHSRLYRIAIAFGLTILMAQGSDVRAMPRAPFAAAVTITDSSFLKQDSVKDSTTGIKGSVTDNKKEPLINASVVVKQNGNVVGGGITDFDGNFMIANLDSGVYDVTVSLLGYHTGILKNVVVSVQKTTELKVVLNSDLKSLREINTIHKTMGLFNPYMSPKRLFFNDTVINMRKEFLTPIKERMTQDNPYDPDKIIIRKDRIKNLPY